MTKKHKILLPDSLHIFTIIFPGSKAKSGWSSTCKKLQELVASVEGMQRTAECEIAECDEHTRVDMLWQALREAQISGAAQERHACGVFLPAVQCIRQMPCARSGLDKALCIKHAMTAVYRVIAEQQMGGSEMTTRSAAIGADDVLPLLCYITLQAAVPCLETEITIMESLLPEELQMGELGYVAVCARCVQTAIIEAAAAQQHTKVVAQARPRAATEKLRSSPGEPQERASFSEGQKRSPKQVAKATEKVYYTSPTSKKVVSKAAETERLMKAMKRGGLL